MLKISLIALLCGGCATPGLWQTTSVTKDIDYAPIMSFGVTAVWDRASMDCSVDQHGGVDASFSFELPQWMD